MVLNQEKNASDFSADVKQKAIVSNGMNQITKFQ
jgi:hypothetical protein